MFSHHTYAVVFYSEYLATFKKTVAMHEVFLQRLTSHPRLRTDSVFTVFLEFDGDVSVNYFTDHIMLALYIAKH